MDNQQQLSLEKKLLEFIQYFKDGNYKDLSIAWNIGEIIRKYLQHITDPTYGKEIIKKLSKTLIDKKIITSKKELYQYIDFATRFPDSLYVTSLNESISWEHIIFLLSVDSYEKHHRLLSQCVKQKWSLEQLQKEASKEIKAQFRPCIDLHQGVVKQIVGKTLNNDKNLKQTLLLSRVQHILPNCIKKII